MFNRISSWPQEDFRRFFCTHSFLLWCIPPWKFQLYSGSLLHLPVSLPAPWIKQSRECLQAHFLYFPSLKIQNLELPIIQCLKTSISYVFSHLLLDLVGDLIQAQLFLPGRGRSPFQRYWCSAVSAQPGGRGQGCSYWRSSRRGGVLCLDELSKHPYLTWWS